MANGINDKPVTLFGMLFQHFKLALSRRRSYSENLQMPTIPLEVAKKGRSVFVRHLDCGSCNGCELALNALNNPVYDIEQYGIQFEASPRHADILVMTGPFTRNLEEAACHTFAAMSEPRIVTIGDCAKDGGIFKDSYAIMGRPPEMETAIERHVPGCPPLPEDLLKALLQLSMGDKPPETM